MTQQIILLIQFFSLTISGGFLNRWRGGWQISWLKITNHQFKRVLVCFVPTISLLLPFHGMIHWWLWPICYLSFFIIGILPGWGSWFFIGRSEDAWKHNADAIWAEWISYLVYGPKWIPSNHGLSPEELKKLTDRFNIIMSPTGEVRPLEWRIKMEKFAMSIRGLGITIPVALILSIYFYFIKDIILWQTIFIMPVGYLMGFCYSIGFKLDLTKFPSWLSITSNVGEFLTGSLIFGAGIFLTSSFCSLFV